MYSFSLDNLNEGNTIVESEETVRSILPRSSQENSVASESESLIPSQLSTTFLSKYCLTLIQIFR